MATRIDPITDAIYRISTWAPQAGITFNQFLIDDERPNRALCEHDCAFRGLLLGRPVPTPDASPGA
jgi:hypothetical protein